MPGKGRVPWLQGVLPTYTAGADLRCACEQEWMATNKIICRISFMGRNFSENYGLRAMRGKCLHLMPGKLDERGK